MLMRKIVLILAAISSLTFLSCETAPMVQDAPAPADVARELDLPAGFQAVAVADHVGAGRHLTVRENGDIYLALRELKDGFGIAALRDTSGDGVADLIEYFGEHPGTGIEARGDFLYFASHLAVYRYRFRDGELIPDSPPEVIAEGFIDQRQHEVKPFAFDDQGHIYVNVGAPSNGCQEQARTPGSPGLDPCPQLERQAGVWRFEADRSGQTQENDGYRFATGIRNSVAIAWNPLSRKLYVVQHGRDQLDHLWPELFSPEQNAELPAEEFFLVEEGDDFGWPYCYYDHLQGKRVLAPEYGGDGTKVGRCDQFVEPILTFPAHWAPNDLLFYTGDQFPQPYRGGAFVAFHGSWNRAPHEQEGYNIVFVPFEGSLPAGGYRVFAEGFAGVDEIHSPADAVHRPTGVAQGPDGSLYVSDSHRGKIWKISYLENP